MLTYLQVADSFHSDPFAQGFGQQQHKKASVDPSSQMLKKPPKWLRRPVGASFAVSMVVFGNHSECHKTHLQSLETPVRTTWVLSKQS